MDYNGKAPGSGGPIAEEAAATSGASIPAANHQYSRPGPHLLCDHGNPKGECRDESLLDAHNPRCPHLDVAWLRAQDRKDDKDEVAVALELARRETTRKADEEEAAQRRIVAVRGDQGHVKLTRWLWAERMPAGRLSLIAGKGSVSKSTFFTWMAAQITNGKLPGEYYGTPRDIGFIANEDDIDETVRPRMMAHGADMKRVHFLKVRTPIGEEAVSLPRDGERICEFITDNDLAALFIDPLSANTGTGNKNDQDHMRKTYQAVNGMAMETKCTIAGLAHTRKQGAADVVEALMGSVEQSNVARSVHGIVTDPEEDGARILSTVKNNLGRDDLPSLRFRVTPFDVACTGDDEGYVTSQPRIEWLDSITDSADDIMADRLYGNTGVDECARWLRGYLMDDGGQALLSDVQRDSKYSESMLKRAKKKAGVRSERAHEVGGPALWYLPETRPPETH